MDIVQLDFSAAFDRVSHSGLLFKLKSIGEGGSVLSICREFLSNRRQRVVVDGATSEWVPIVSGVPQEVYWVLFRSSFTPVKCLSWWRTDYMHYMVEMCIQVRWIHHTYSTHESLSMLEGVSELVLFCLFLLILWFGLTQSLVVSRSL